MVFFSECAIFNILALAAFVFIAIYLYFKYCYSFWQKTGIPFIEPEFPYGNFKDSLKTIRPVGAVLIDYYNVMKKKGHRYFGTYFITNPTLIPICPDLIKNIMSRDFEHFIDRGMFYDEENDPLSAHLFSLEGQKWKNLRAKLSPTFSSGKLKNMFETLVNCSTELRNCLNESIKTNEPINIKQILAKYTTDVIGSCAFGIECNSFKDPDIEFIRLGNTMFKPTGVDRIKRFLAFTSPAIVKFFKMRITNSEVDTFYRKLVKDTIEYREKNNVIRNDFMQLLMQLKNQGTVEEEKQEHEYKKNKGVDSSFTMNEITAQAFLFFIAGFETSSTALTWSLFELALNEQIQNKLREEILRILKKHDGKITYDGIMEMHYMDLIIHETLRKHSPAMMIKRVVTKDYRLDENVVLKKGTEILIPVLAIHEDPEYYPDPEKFDPERFTEDNKSTRPDFTWLPFGGGPRICIGLRFAMLEVKVGLSQLLLNYKLTLNPKTLNPPVLDPLSFVNNAKGSIWLDAEKIVK